MQQSDRGDGATGRELRGTAGGLGTRKPLQLCVTMLQSAELIAGLRGTGCVGECGQQGDGERQWEGPDQEQGELLSASLAVTKYLAKSRLREEDFWRPCFEGIRCVMVM